MNSNGTRSKMDLSKLEETIESLHNLAGADLGEITTQGQLIGIQKTAEEAARLLEYFSEKTENNRLYHKKQNIKKNLAQKLLRKMLSADELKNLDDQVNEQLGDTLHIPTSDAD